MLSTQRLPGRITGSTSRAGIGILIHRNIAMREGKECHPGSMASRNAAKLMGPASASLSAACAAASDVEPRCAVASSRITTRGRASSNRGVSGAHRRRGYPAAAGHQLVVVRTCLPHWPCRCRGWIEHAEWEGISHAGDSG
jgi:hypothetical protein